jgi:hypothetical protein
MAVLRGAATQMGPSWLLGPSEVAEPQTVQGGLCVYTDDVATVLRTELPYIASNHTPARALTYGSPSASKQPPTRPDPLLRPRAAAKLPYKMPVKVLDAPASVGKEDGTSTRHVVVEGGITVTAPSFVRTGDVIVVRTEDATYMTKG